MAGGHYTYAEVPLGYWMQDAFGFARNRYDRVSHFAQGDPWDTFFALIGSLAAQLTLSRRHDRQLAALASRESY